MTGSRQLHRRVYKLMGINAMLVMLSFILPRLASNPEGGFAAAGANAILVMFIMLAISLVYSVYLLAVTVGHYRELSATARIAGLGPFILIAAALLGLLVFLMY